MVDSRVTFLHPFRLEGVEDIQMPGTYSISSTVSHHWVFPFTWKRCQDVSIRLCSTPGRWGKLQDFDISLTNLFAAQSRDRNLVVVEDPFAKGG